LTIKQPVLEVAPLEESKSSTAEVSGDGLEGVLNEPVGDYVPKSKKPKAKLLNNFFAKREKKTTEERV